jgi:hypothetical protein
MTTATAPTAPTDPGEGSSAAVASAPSEPAAVPGPLARILTPVEPARPVRPLGTTAAMSQTPDRTSSNDEPATAAKASSRGSVVAALGHALAERLRRGGTSVKRTHDIKETRVSGASSNTANANKAERLAKHDGQHRTNRDAKLTDLNSKVSQRHGRDTRDLKKADTSDAKTSATKAARDNRDAKQADTKSTAKAAKADTVTKHDDRDYHDTKTAKTHGPKAAGPGGVKDGAAAKTPGSPKPDDAPRPTGPDMVKRPDPKGLNTKTAPVSKDAGIEQNAPKPGPALKSTATMAAAPAAPKQRTRAAREAGYRDGTRGAAVVGQARAYRDGARDGWDDRTAADKAEGRTMADTRVRNATKPKAEAAPKMTPATGSTVDLAKKTAPAAAAPVTVTAVGDNAVTFTAPSGTSHTMSRGEVRTLKGFERRMAAKKTALGHVEESSKTTRSLAVELARRAHGLAEDAKSIAGGPHLVGVLTRLAERAKALRDRAEEIEKSAHRGREAVAVLASNAETRHGGIYKAVVDSPLTAPAEREFYMDKEGN